MSNPTIEAEKARHKLIEQVDKFINKELVNIEENPQDYDGVTEPDFVLWFHEWGS